MDGATCHTMFFEVVLVVVFSWVEGGSGLYFCDDFVFELFGLVKVLFGLFCLGFLVGCVVEDDGAVL